MISSGIVINWTLKHFCVPKNKFVIISFEKKIAKKHIVILGPISQWCHYHDVTMDAIASQITSLTIVYSTVYSDADQRKHQNSALLAFVWGIHRGPVNFPHKWPVTRKMFPFDEVIMVHEFQTCSFSFSCWPWKPCVRCHRNRVGEIFYFLIVLDLVCKHRIEGLLEPVL